jgi:hypothetical protein
MPKSLCHGLVLTCLLTGCSAPMQVLLTPEVIEREGEITSATSGIPAIVRAMPSPRAAVVPRSRGTNTSGATQASGESASEAGSGAEVAQESGRSSPYLRVNGEAAPILTLVPIFDDTNTPTAVMAKPAAGTLEWTLQGAGGPLALTKARVVLRREANRPTIAEEPAEGEEPVTPEPEQGEPLSVDLAAAEVGLPSTTGGTFRLTLDLKGPLGRQFFAANPNAAKASATITLLDEAGQPAPGQDGQPLALTAVITVL